MHKQVCEEGPAHEAGGPEVSTAVVLLWHQPKPSTSPELLQKGDLCGKLRVSLMSTHLLLISRKGILAPAKMLCVLLLFMADTLCHGLSFATSQLHLDSLFSLIPGLLHPPVWVMCFIPAVLPLGPL